ncbi:unnamed protein product, partial [Durusdinium trenchii]
MINAARLEKRSGEAFQPSHQYEINFKARQTSSFRLPEHTCQFIDIGRLLNVDDMKELKQLESASDELGEEVWKFLKGKKLQTTELCSRHKQRYDVFILEKYFSVVDDPEAVYLELSTMLQDKISPVKMEHIAWVTEERDLLEEISESANKNAAAPTGKVTAEHLKDWLQFLSATELQNYEAYLEKLGLGSTPREERPLRAVAVGQNPDKLFMAGSEKSLPAFVGVQAALWIRDAQKELEGASRKVLQSHLQAAGVKVPRTKDDMATALIRFRYKAKDFGCICCQE